MLCLNFIKVHIVIAGSRMLSYLDLGLIQQGVYVIFTKVVLTSAPLGQEPHVSLENLLQQHSPAVKYSSLCLTAPVVDYLKKLQFSLARYSL